MIFQTHIPRFPLDKFIEIFIYYEGVQYPHNVDRFLPNGDTEILIDFHDTPQYIYDNETLKEIQACNHVWASGLRTEPITIPSGTNAAMIVNDYNGLTDGLECNNKLGKCDSKALEAGAEQSFKTCNLATRSVALLT